MTWHMQKLIEAFWRKKTPSTVFFRVLEPQTRYNIQLTKLTKLTTDILAFAGPPVTDTY
jgi:fructose-1-phosphate kinase PfkB-like protein